MAAKATTLLIQLPVVQVVLAVVVVVAELKQAAQAIKEVIHP
jgi:cytochrome c-type biogenesis protein CcmH/NrfF